MDSTNGWSHRKVLPPFSRTHMKPSSNVLAVLTALSCLSALAWSSTPEDTELSVRSPKGIAVTADSPIARKYPQTKCLDFQRKHKTLGFLCLSTSKQFATDFGISVRTNSSGVQDQVRVASGMSIYDMKPTIINGYTIFTVEVDCDDGNGPLYRPTATCHVAFMPTANSHFFYSNFVLSKEGASTSGIGERTIMGVWRALVSVNGAHE